MAIQITCPNCKNVIRVDEKMAGKTGKCKCGAAIKVPMAKAAAAASAAGAMAGVFDQLAESDFNRESPLQKFYAPSTATKDDTASLKRFQNTDDGGKKIEAGKLTGTLIFAAVLALIGGIVAIAMIVVLVAATTMVADIAASVPLLGAGLGIGIAVFSMFALVGFGGGIGLLMKKKWGWFLIAIIYAFLMVDRIVGLILVIVTGFSTGKFIAAMVPFVITVLISNAVFGEEAAKVLKIRKPTLKYIAGAIGAIAGLALYGALWGMGTLIQDDGL